MNAGSKPADKADKAEVPAEETEAASSGRSISDAEWLTMTGAVVLLCGVMSVVTLTKKKGGENHAA